MIYNDLLNWIKTLPYWQQMVSSKILRNENINEIICDELYEIFKAENGLSETELEKNNIDFPESVEQADNIDTIMWKGVQNIKGINALKNGEGVEVNNALNLLYGENGSGKSGYARLFNNAFISKGDKNLVPNIYESTHEEVYAQFVFCRAEQDYVLEYPKEKDSAEFKRVMVFDTKSASCDMNNESELSFVPSEFRFFDKLLQICNEIEKRLEKEIEKNNIANPFLIFFESPNNVRNIIESLNEKTNVDNWEKYVLSEEEIENLGSIETEKAKLIALNIDEKSKKLNRIKNEIIKIIDLVNITNFCFTEDSINGLGEILKNIQEAEILSKKEGLEQFKNDHIEKLGSEEWKDFLSAAQKYYKYIGKDIKSCIFCGQSIEGVELIDKYWLYLGSVAETNLKTLKGIVDEKLKKYSSFETFVPGEDSLCGEWMILNCCDEYKELSEGFAYIEKQKDKIIESLVSGKWDDDIHEYQISKDILQKMLLRIENEIAKLKEDEVSKKIKELSDKEIEYKDRQKLTQLLPQIRDYIAKLKWVTLGTKKKIKTRSITNKQKELFSKYVTEDYIKIFENECKKLNANFNAEIVQRGSKGVTLKRIAIKGEIPGKILSEGEQRAICIANFIAEATMTPNNIAVIFDDPVSSLDHNRRRVIAERLAEEARKRQVIVFTHDITFLMELKTICEKENVELTLQTIRKIVNKPGCVSKVIPWQSMTVKERIKKLNVDLQNMQRMEKEGEVDDYFYKAKMWCELLRESWERSVEEILLNDAVQRYNPCVQTQRLAKAPFTIELYGEVEKGMTECSSWVHDRAKALNGGVPTTDELKTYIDTFNEFVKKNRPK